MFLRRKKSNLNDVAVAQPAFHSTAPGAPSTPLYERFATSARSAASAPISPGRSSVAISRPMALGVKSGNVGGIASAGGPSSRVSSEGGFTRAGTSPPSSTSMVPNPNARKPSAGNLRDRERIYNSPPPVPPTSKSRQNRSRVTDEWSSGDEVSSDTERYGGPRRSTRQPQHPTPLSPPTSPEARKRLAKTKNQDAKTNTPRHPTPPSPRSKPLPSPVPDQLEPPLPRLTIPPSASSSESGSSYGAPTPTATSAPPNLSTAPSRSPYSSPSPSSKSTPATSPTSPSVDESGFVAKTGSGNGPALGNSLTSRAPPIRRKYSPLAAFGPSTDEPRPPAPPSIIVSSSSASETVIGSDAKVKSSAVLNGASSQTSPQLSPSVSAESSLAEAPSQERSALSKADLSERHASFQPLKTASVELRVAFNPEEKKFHSPLFASFVSVSNGDARQTSPSANGIPPATEHSGANEYKAKKERGKNVISTSTRQEMNDLNGAGLGRSARTLPVLPSFAPSPIPNPPQEERPTPSSSSRGKQEQPSSRTRSPSKMRQRTNSTSSTSSTGRRREAPAAQRLPELPTERAQPPQREILYATGPSRQPSKESISNKAKQIPTPPTSVDGHSIKSGKGSSAKAAQLDGYTSSDGRSVRSARNKADPDQDLSLASNATTANRDTRVPKSSSSKKRIETEETLNQRQKPELLTVASLSLRDNSPEQHTSPTIPTIDSTPSPTLRNGDATTSRSGTSNNLNDLANSPPHSHVTSTQPINMPLAPGSRRARSGSASRKTIEVGSPSGQTSRKLYKQPPAMHLVPAQPVESPIDLATGAEMSKDADPFAKDDVLRTPTAPFAQTHSDSAPSSPSTPDDYFAARSKRRGERLEKRPEEVIVREHGPNGHSMANGDGEATPRAFDGPETKEEMEEEEAEPEPEREPTFYPIERHLTTQPLLAGLLPYLTFRDWCIITEVNDAMRRTVEHRKELRETVLEYYLSTVGYSRWKWPKKEPLMLTFRDLNSYMRGVSIPSHLYANIAKQWLDSRVVGDPDRSIGVQKTLFASSCRAYTRVVLRLRAQAEADAEEGGGVYEFSPSHSTVSVNSPHSRYPTSRSRPASRPASPTSSVGHSAFSHSNIGHGRYAQSEHGRAGSGNGQQLVPRFRSPLFRVGHAPFLRVFVPNQEGEWLSDQSVTDCEKELKRAGVLPLLRVGDVVWDAAVGDEGNVGRMVWDGNYLIDLDYTYSRIGELPQYLHTLAFPPSYFHRVIRTNSNPLCYIDISPWGEEIAVNLQLLQDRIRTETPQGGHHTVVRWIHRSKFRVRPNPFTNAPIPISGTSLTIDPGWYGYIIVETEGTNEGLADLQDRCRGIGFPPRAGAPQNKVPSKVFRLLRERSRPKEIWIRAVREKERIL